MQKSGSRGQGDTQDSMNYYDNGQFSPASNYDLTSPEYNRTGFQPTQADRKMTYSSFDPPANTFVDDSQTRFDDVTMGEYGAARSRSSVLLDVNDSVSLHLLVETAMCDSQTYELLSYDQVENLKRELQELDPRIEAARKKLAIEAKIRDAAQSINRLYSSKKDGQTSPKRNRRSMNNRSSVGSVKSLSDAAYKSDNDIAASIKKCDDLARDLWQLEARKGDLQTQLLKHTAGILQMTHAGPTKKEAMKVQANGVPGGRPDSPQSIYNYDTSRGRYSSNRTDGFDERSLYRSAENLDNLMGALRDGTQHSTIDEFSNFAGDNKVLQSVEKRLEELNNRLRDVLVKTNPEKNQNYASAPRTMNKGDELTIDQHLDYLDQGLRDIAAGQSDLQRQSRHSQSEVEGRLEGLNNQVCGLINNIQPATNDPYPLPPRVSGRSAQEQINYLEEALFAVEQSAGQSSQHGDVAAYEATLTGLWSVILAGEEEARQRKRQRRQAIANDPDSLEKEEDFSPDEGGDQDEPFSLPAFSSKVQRLHTRASNLKEQQNILRRQIRQQRELNSKSDVEREQQVEKMNADIQQARDLHKAAHEQHQDAEQEIARMVEEISRLKLLDQKASANSNELAATEQARRTAEQKMQDLEAELTSLQDDARIEASEFQAQLQESTERIEKLEQELKNITNAREEAEISAMEASGALEAKEKELLHLEGEVARLQTEVTIAKAELDGAYGTRAQRAAEVASNPEIKKELDELSAKNVTMLAEIQSLRKAQDEANRKESAITSSEQMLREELRGMTQEYETLTKDSIQNEKDRDSLEALIDTLRSEKEKLEMELSDEKVRWLGARSPTSGATGPEMTSVRMMREDFKKMMREKTAEALKALRAEQEERRKLEALVRQLRKGSADVNRSGLHQNWTAS